VTLVLKTSSYTVLNFLNSEITTSCPCTVEFVRLSGSENRQRPRFEPGILECRELSAVQLNLLERPIWNLEDNIKMNLTEIGCVDERWTEQLLHLSAS
jgi:hypothetical protein